MEECPGLTPSDLTDAIGGSWSFWFVFNDSGPGVAVNAMLTTMCGFVSTDEPPPDANQTDSITVSFELTASPSEAQLEYNARRPLYGGGQEPEFIDGMGDEAYAFDGLVVVRIGAELLVVSVGSDNPDLRQQIRPLTEYLVARYWP